MKLNENDDFFIDASDHLGSLNGHVLVQQALDATKPFAAMSLGDFAQAFVHKLNSADTQSRIEACEDLADMGPYAAVAIPELIALLSCKFHGLRLSATFALTAIGSAAVPHVLKETGLDLWNTKDRLIKKVVCDLFGSSAILDEDKFFHYSIARPAETRSSISAAAGRELMQDKSFHNSDNWSSGNTTCFATAVTVLRGLIKPMQDYFESSCRQLTATESVVFPSDPKKQLSKAKYKHFLGLLHRLKHGVNGTDLLDLDVSWHEHVAGHCMLVRDQGGPLLETRLEIVAFHDPSSQELVVVAVNTAWSRNRVVADSVLQTCGAFFSDYVARGRHLGHGVNVEELLEGDVVAGQD